VKKRLAEGTRHAQSRNTGLAGVLGAQGYVTSAAPSVKALSLA